MVTLPTEKISEIFEVFTPKDETAYATEKDVPKEVQHFFDKEKITYTPERGKADALMLDILEKDPNITIEDLRNRVNTEIDEKIATDEKEFVESRLEIIAARRENVQQVLSEHASPADLFEHLFGIPPQGQIEIVPGALSINLMCHDDRDLNYIFEEKYTQHPRLSIRGIVYGCAVNECLDSRVNKAVLAIGLNQKADTSLDSPANKLKHEELHIVNWLFMEDTDMHILDGYPTREEIARLPYDARLEVLKEYLPMAREITLEQSVKFELAGYYAQGATTELASKVIKRYQFSEQEPAIFKEKFTADLADAEKSIVTELIDRTFVGFDDVVSKACDSLKEMEKAGYTSKEIAMRLANTYLRQLV